MNLNINKIYYYIICLFASFILLWGVVDLISSVSTYVSTKTISNYEKNSDENIENFYQKKVAQDRLFDSFARIVVSGAVFVYCRKKANLA